MGGGAGAAIGSRQGEAVREGEALEESCRWGQTPFLLGVGGCGWWCASRFHTHGGEGG
jgi:hypothetical protein